MNRQVITTKMKVKLKVLSTFLWITILLGLPNFTTTFPTVDKDNVDNNLLDFGDATVSFNKN